MDVQVNKKKNKSRSKVIKHNFVITLFCNIVIIIILTITSLFANFIDESSNKIMPIKTTVPTTTCEIEFNKSIETINEMNESKEIDTSSTHFYFEDWNSNTEYLLAKMAMAEAEDCPIETKEFVILTILNRVWSNNFPDTVEDVIFQKINGTAQFTPIIDGRWERAEPNADCWTALHNVKEAIYDKSQGCTFFESCANSDNWHSRNLIFLFESGGVRFYKESKG